MMTVHLHIENCEINTAKKYLKFFAINNMIVKFKKRKKKAWFIALHSILPNTIHIFFWKNDIPGTYHLLSFSFHLQIGQYAPSFIAHTTYWFHLLRKDDLSSALMTYFFQKQYRTSSNQVSETMKRCRYFTGRTKRVGTSISIKKHQEDAC